MSCSSGTVIVWLPPPAALHLSEYTRHLFEVMDEIRREFHTEVVADSRPFVLATGLTTLMYRMGVPIWALRRKFPLNEIRIVTGSTEYVVSGLQARQFDLGIVSLPVTAEGIRVTPLFEEENGDGGKPGTRRPPQAPRHRTFGHR